MFSQQGPSYISFVSAHSAFRPTVQSAFQPMRSDFDTQVRIKKFKDSLKELKDKDFKLQQTQNKIETDLCFPTPDFEDFQKKIMLQASISTSESESKISEEKSVDLSQKEIKMRQNSNNGRLRSRKPFKYDFDSQQQQNEKLIKPCETKNIIKNFMRSVISFTRKNEQYVKRLLIEQKIDEVQFINFIQKLQGKINTITQLRQLWTKSKYDKIFRVLSNHFLRKYYRKHIFHSRIFNYQIHLKYRIKLLDSLEKPQQFTCLKQL